MPMRDFRTDDAMVARLRASFAEVLQHGDQLAEAFYRRLFDQRPDFRSMFTTDAALQRQKVMESMETIVSVLDDEPGLDAYLAELGSRHTTYGVAPDHYEAVIIAFSGAFSDVLGPSMDPELAEDWRDTLRVISQLMMAPSSGS